MQAFCRYGPAKAYLPADDLYAGDRAIVHNRNWNGAWLWILVEKDGRHCWAAASVLDVTGDVSRLVEYYHPLPQSVLYGPPGWVNAERQGDTVVVTWAKVNMTEDDDRGYFLKVRVCQSGYLVDIVASTMETTYSFTDEAGKCESASGGEVFTVEKHGYTGPASIPWP